MKTAIVIAGLGALGAQAVRIIQSNDDGWAESYIRTLNDALNEAGHDVVLSAPADNKSGSSSLDIPPSPRKQPCQYNSCPANSGPVGSDPKRPDLNWVNSFPVTSIRYGIDTFGPQMWDGEAPELAVTGPNVGTNLGIQVPFSGTVGAACYAAHDAGIPAIAFSGASEGNLPYTDPAPPRSLIYAELATILTDKIIEGGKPYLPDDVFLNVNFPEVQQGCNKVEDFKWVLSRITWGLLSPKDVTWCGEDRLPQENDVLKAGCYISVSVGDAKDKTTSNDVKKQQAVLTKIQDLLVCLP
ncbi:hypothetical protein NLU13_9596 [Sarocladium strictum]|uniref:Survival protein SurE-like phosphatase/nucleotidase domain-containing protein n=1 Tax=Sarocladium strictum TaxID=5046 RepID=A0AA39GAF4_SARSR|nr:hypothetical protein NLU13_9596 [Sarocladium strictum]